MRLLENHPEIQEKIEEGMLTMYKGLLKNPEDVKTLLNQIEVKQEEELRLIRRDIFKGSLDQDQGDQRSHKVIARYTKMSLKVLWDQFHLNTKD
jgi:hypothetical protein